MRAQISNRDYEILSSYLDGQLSSNERQKLEASLLKRPELKSELEDLRQTRTLLRMIPRKRAPRNFTLTPDMVAGLAIKRTILHIPSLFPALSFASAVATFALIVSFFVNAPSGLQLTQVADQQSKEVAMAPAPEIVSEAAETEPVGEFAAAESEAEQEDPAALAPEIGISEAPSPQIEGKIAPEMGIGGGDGYVIIPGYGSITGEYASIPAPMGMGGGDGINYGENSFSGPIIIPLEGVNSIVESQPPTTAGENLGVERDRSFIQNTGPILGVPVSENEGQIIIKSAWGQPLEYSTDEVASEQLDQDQRQLIDLPRLQIIQILLALLAVVTGISAFFLHRRNLR